MVAMALAIWLRSLGATSINLPRMETWKGMETNMPVYSMIFHHIPSFSGHMPYSIKSLDCDDMKIVKTSTDMCILASFQRVNLDTGQFTWWNRLAQYFLVFTLKSISFRPNCHSLRDCLRYYWDKPKNNIYLCIYIYTCATVKTWYWFHGHQFRGYRSSRLPIASHSGSSLFAKNHICIHINI